MTPVARTQWAGGAVCAAMIACAMWAAPRSCEGGLEAYVLAGVIGVVALSAIPLLLRTDRSGPQRVLHGALFAAMGLAVWLGGLFGANVRILCRLF